MPSYIIQSSSTHVEMYSEITSSPLLTLQLMSERLYRYMHFCHSLVIFLGFSVSSFMLGINLFLKQYKFY